MEKAVAAARIGEATQVRRTIRSDCRLESLIPFSSKRRKPIMAPTTACEVETGNPNLVIPAIAMAAAKETLNAQLNVSICPKLPNVSMAAGPFTNPPRTMKSEANLTAVEKRTICEVTAVPKTLAASFAPKDQPRNKPLDSQASTATEDASVRI